MPASTISLDGTWEFRFDPDGSLGMEPPGPARPIQVPAPWQAQFDDLHLASGVGWYRRAFEIPEDWRSATILLRFGAVDYLAEVWLNGQHLGEHEGGYLPFSFEIQDVARFGLPNELVVRAADPGPDAPEAFPAYRFVEIPHGKQSWYGPLGGIWQSVTLERRGVTYVRELRLTPRPTSGQVEVEARLAGAAVEPSTVDNLVVRVFGPDGAIAGATEVPLAPGPDAQTTEVAVHQFRLWDLDDPVLYRAEVELRRGSDVVDSAAATFGFRTIEARDGQIVLNGRPIYLRGALDQDYYPDTISTPPSEAFLEDRFREAKALGLNCLRCHIKVPDPRYYDLADRLGLLIWTELPSWGGRARAPEVYQGRTPLAAERAWQTLEGIVERDWNHPSIVCWTIVNEDWGTKLPTEASDRAWLRETYDRLKGLDPNRLVVDNSPCRPNFHVKSDLDDYHFYCAIPDHAATWSQTVAEFAQRPAWTYSPHGDAVRAGQEPLVVSEFGNWGLPNVHDLVRCYGGREPWWIDTGAEWGAGRTRGSVHPKGVLDRVAALGLARAFGSYASFVAASQEQEYQALKYEIEELRRQNPIQGYVITELTDVQWECNGLLDQCDNPKAFQPIFHRINADDVIVPTLASGPRRAFWSGEDVAIDLVLSRFSRADLAAATLRWWVEMASDHEGASPDETPGMSLNGRVLHPGGELAPPAFPAFQATPVGRARFAAPEVEAPAAARFVVELRDSATLIARNEIDLYLFPRIARRAPVPRALRLLGPPERVASLETALGALGYTVVDDPRRADVVVAVGVDDTVVGLARSGARTLAIVEGAVGVSANLAPIKVVDRKGSGYEGDWASSFSWLYPDRLGAGLPAGPRLDWAFAEVIPEAVILGPDPGEIGRTALAGLFVGWVQKPAALALPVPLGAGTLLLTTLRLLPGLGRDPVATALFAQLIEALSAGERGSAVE